MKTNPIIVNELLPSLHVSLKQAHNYTFRDFTFSLKLLLLFVRFVLVHRQLNLNANQRIEINSNFDETGISLLWKLFILFVKTDGNSIDEFISSHVAKLLCYRNTFDILWKHEARLIVFVQFRLCRLSVKKQHAKQITEHVWP